MNSLDAWSILGERTALYAKPDFLQDEYETFRIQMSNKTRKEGGCYLPESSQQGELMLRQLLMHSEKLMLGQYFLNKQ